MHVRSLKYGLPILLYVMAFLSFGFKGWICFLPMVYAWLFIPLLELLLKPNAGNLTEAEEEMAKADMVYDFMLYLILPLQYFALFYFLTSLRDQGLSVFDKIGRISTMGLLCGSFGINVGHELGHRVNLLEQYMAKALLMTSLYMHFFIEHNKGHHKRVATPEDPGSARFGEMVYAFYLRAIAGSYISAWRIANKEPRQKGLPAIHWKNEMIQFQLLQLLLVLTIFWIFGFLILAYYVLAAFMGILLLETVNYIEHYGLSRSSRGMGKYERALPRHSWNSDHLLGRLMLFELSRHSDHHYLASRKYQVLRHHDEAPQMPTGYPGMMLLALLPPLWFRVMNKRVRHIMSVRD